MKKIAQIVKYIREEVHDAERLSGSFRRTGSKKVLRPNR